MEIDYGRLDALEAALGGRAAIAEAFGRGAPMVSRRYYKDTAHDTPGLANGVVIYTPKVGELLLDAWVQQDEVWNGTSPKFDLGTFIPQPGAPLLPMVEGWGIYKLWAGDTADLSQDFRDVELLGAGLAGPTNLAVPSLRGLDGAWNAFAGLAIPAIPSTPQAQQAPAYGDLFITSADDGWRAVPLRFTATHPLKCVVSQTALPGGAASGATQGKIRVYVEIGAASPAPG